MGEGVDWNLLAQYPNAGQAFEQSFQQGIANGQKQVGQNALAQYAQDPTNSQALGTAIKYDPATAVTLMNAETERQRYSQQGNQQQLEQWHKYAGNLAQWANTPEKWDQAVDYLLSQNHPDISTSDLMALKGKFSPALRQSFMSLGGVTDPQPTDLQRNTDYLNSKQSGLGDAYMQNEADKPVPVQTANADGTITVNWVRPPLNVPSIAGGASVGHGSAPTPPQGAVAYLKAHPGLAAQFDQKYGSGASAAILKGGQSGAGSTGGFPQ